MADAYATQKANKQDGVIKRRDYAGAALRRSHLPFRRRQWLASAGRQKIAFLCGERQCALLAYRKGEVDLTFVGGKGIWPLFVTSRTARRLCLEDSLGVDLQAARL